MRTSVIILSLIAGAFAQSPFFGRCPVVQVQQNFDVARYMGRWYEVKRYFAFFELFSNCVTADYALLPNGTVTVNNTGYNYLREEYTTAIGDAIVEKKSEPAKLGVKFPQSPSRGDYWVLSTDYENYTIVWSCSQASFLPFNTQFAWVLSRTPELSSTSLDKAYGILDKLKISTSRFSTTSQANCPGRQ